MQSLHVLASCSVLIGTISALCDFDPVAGDSMTRHVHNYTSSHNLLPMEAEIHPTESFIKKAIASLA